MAGQKTDERDVALGRRIAEERKRSKLTQRQVAQSFGMSAAQLQKYEKGTNRISAIHLASFARMTGVPLADFFERAAQAEEARRRGFLEEEQQSFSSDVAAEDVAAAVWRFIEARCSERSRHDFVILFDALGSRLKG